MPFQVTRKNYREWNEVMIDKYDPDLYHTNSHLFIQIIIKLLIRKMLGMLDLDRMDRFLDVGCGAGNVIESLKPHSHLFGVDLSFKLLRKAEKRCGESVGLSSGAVEALPFLDVSFQKILCTEVIEHLLNPEACLKEIDRVTTNDAVIVVSTTNERFLNHMKSVFWRVGLHKLLFRGDGYKPEKRMDDEWHLQAFDPASFKCLLGKYFHLDKISFIPSILCPIHIIVKCTKKKVID